MSINRQAFNQQSSVSPIKNQMNSSPTPDSIFMQQQPGNPINRGGQNGVSANGMMNGGVSNTNFSIPSSGRWTGIPNPQQQQSSPQQSTNNYGQQFPFNQPPTNKLNNSNNSINSYGQQSNQQSPQPQLRRSSEFNSGGWNTYQNSNSNNSNSMNNSNNSINKMGSMMKSGGSNSSSLNNSNGLGSGSGKTKYSKDELLNLYDPMAKIPENLISHTHILSEEVQQPINFSFDSNLSKSRDRTRMLNNSMNRGGIRKDMSHDRMKKYNSSSSQSWRNKEGDERKVWYYLDPQNCTQGPFSSIEMDSWNKAGYFTPSLMVKKGDSSFVELKKLLVVYPDSPFSSIGDIRSLEKEDTSSHSTENEDEEALRSEQDSLEEEIEKRFEKDLLKPTLFDDVKKSKDNFVPLESPTQTSQPSISSPYGIDSTSIERSISPPYNTLNTAPVSSSTSSSSSSSATTTTTTSSAFDSLQQQQQSHPQQQQQQMWQQQQPQQQQPQQQQPQQQQQQQMWDNQLQNNMGMNNSNEQVYKYMLYQQLQMIQQKLTMCQQYINSLGHQYQQIQQQPQTQQTQLQLQQIQQQQTQSTQQYIILQQKFMQTQYQFQSPFQPFQYQQFQQSPQQQHPHMYPQQPNQQQLQQFQAFQQLQPNYFLQQLQQQQAFQQQSQQIEQQPEQQSSEQTTEPSIESVEQNNLNNNEQEQVQQEQIEQTVQETQETFVDQVKEPEQVEQEEIGTQVEVATTTTTVQTSTTTTVQETIIQNEENFWGKTSTVQESKTTSAQLKVQQDELKTPEIEQQVEVIEKSNNAASPVNTTADAPISMINPWAASESAPKKKSLAEIQAEEREQKKREMEEAKIRSIENSKNQPKNVMNWAGAGAPTWSVETGVKSLSLKDIQEEEIREKKESPIVDNASDFERKKPVSLSDVMREQAKEKEKKQQDQQQQSPQESKPAFNPNSPWSVEYSPAKNNHHDVWSEQTTVSAPISTSASNLNNSTNSSSPSVSLSTPPTSNNKTPLSVRSNAPAPVYQSKPSDFPTLNILPNKPATIVKNSNPVSSIKKTTVVATPGQGRPDFIKWCHQQLKSLTNNDVGVITELLCSLKTESEIRECAKECLGFTSDVDNFINDYLLARSDEPGLTFESSSPVITIPIKKQPKSQSSSSTAQKQKKKK